MLVDNTAMVGETASIPDNQCFGQLRFGRMRRYFLRSLDAKVIAATTALHKTFTRNAGRATRRDHEDIFAECLEQTESSH